MGNITLPYTITNGQTTDANKVMANLNAIIAEVNGNLESVNIKDLAVITDKLAALAVTAAKIATDAVETLKIKDANVTTPKLADDSVTDDKLNADCAGAGLTQDANGALKVNVDDSTIEVVTNVVRVKDGGIIAVKIAADNITNPKIADDAVQAENIAGLTKTGDVSLDNIPIGTTRGNIVILAMTAQAPAGTYNGTGDSKVRVKEDITDVPTSGTLEIAGDEYAYTAVTVADKEFTLSGTLSKNYAEDDPVYIKTIIRNLTVSGKATILGGLVGKAEAVKDQGGIATNGLKCKVININDWNMDLTDNFTVAHGLTFANILSVSGYIRNDFNTACYPIVFGYNAEVDIWAYWDATNINMSRKISGLFDNTSYDSTSYNRGKLIIQYEA